MKTLATVIFCAALTGYIVTTLAVAPAKPKPVVVYVLIEAETAQELSVRVNSKLAAGYTCVGGAHHRTYVNALDMNEHRYTQAVQKD
jgi:hypothetical protein